MGLGILELLEVWPTPAPVPGSKKSYDSQGETSFTAKVKENQELHFCMLTDDYISFGAGIISRGPQSCNLKSHLWDVGWTHYLGPFPNRDSRLLLTRVFSVLFQSGCRLSAQFGDIYAVTSAVSFLSMTVYWNWAKQSSIKNWNCLCGTSDFFC